MNRRPSHEPWRPLPQPRRLWDDATPHAPSLGSPTCLERDRCGGVRTNAGVLDYRDLCSCQDKTKCDMVCRFNPRTFVARMREVGGLGFETEPRAAVIGVPRLRAEISRNPAPILMNWMKSPRASGKQTSCEPLPAGCLGPGDHTSC